MNTTAYSSGAIKAQYLEKGNSIPLPLRCSGIVADRVASTHWPVGTCGRNLCTFTIGTFERKVRVTSGGDVFPSGTFDGANPDSPTFQLLTGWN